MVTTPIAGVNEYDLGVVYGLSKADMKKHIKVFNESAAICCIPPLRDAVKYVRKMHEELGCVFSLYYKSKSESVFRRST